LLSFLFFGTHADIFLELIEKQISESAAASQQQQHHQPQHHASHSPLAETPATFASEATASLPAPAVEPVSKII
jgi:hypothetical protein